MVQPIILDRLKQDWYGPTWVLDSATGIWTNTPTLVGGSLLTDGGMEAWTTPTNLTSWSESVAGTSTVNQETSIIHGGSNAARIDLDASNSFAYIAQAIAATANSWIMSSVWVRTSLAGKTGRMDIVGSSTLVGPGLNPGTTYTQYINTFRIPSTNPLFRLSRDSSASASLYYDDASVSLVSFPTLFKTRLFPSALGDVAAKLVNSPAGTQAGVCMGLDSYSSPLYGAIAYHNGINIKLEYFLNGAWTTAINTAVPFQANALAEIRHTATTTYQLWYADSQVLGDVTINDATLNASRRHGLISTYGGNQIKDFSFVPA